MAAAALTPRVRLLLLCDEAIESEVEEGVFTLEGVRQHLGGSLPLRAQLSVFLVLFSARKGLFRGKVVIVNMKTDRSSRYLKFRVEFDDDHQVVPLSLDLGWCDFAEAGVYAAQVWFSPEKGQDVLKAELPFDLLELEE